VDPREVIADYERWLDERVPTVAAGRRQKHQRMRESPFAFLRGSYPVWLVHTADAVQGQPVLAVGDLHVDNFGTWRTADGGPGWGVNDLDEATSLPFASDLIRLATSALVAEGPQSGNRHTIADAVLAGYRRGLESPGAPPDAPEIPEDVGFWARIDALPDASDPPPDIIRLLAAALPPNAEAQRIASRIAGLGSRDHLRYVVIATDGTDRLAREAKVLAPPATAWRDRTSAQVGTTAAAIAREARHDGDPTLHFQDGVVIRRLAPDCGRVELAHVPRRHARSDLLRAMGQATASLHLGSVDAPELLEALDARPAGWLADDIETMRHHTEHDWRRWRDR
jgi:Uncharacterized protein conserved in bacteria (DUF2252)